MEIWVESEKIWPRQIVFEDLEGDTDEFLNAVLDNFVKMTKGKIVKTEGACYTVDIGKLDAEDAHAYILDAVDEATEKEGR